MPQLNAELSRKVLITGIIVSLLLTVAALLMPALIFTPAKFSYSLLEKIIFLSRLFLWLSLLLTYFYARFIEKQSFLLYKEKKYPLLFYPASVSVVVITLIFTSIIVSLILKFTGFISPPAKVIKHLIYILKYDKALMWFIILTAGCLEELVFRGYMLPRLEIIFRNKYMPVIISSLLFGLIHFGYHTIQNIVIPIFIGVALAVFYMRYKSLIAAMLAHALYDFLILLLQINYHSPHS